MHESPARKLSNPLKTALNQKYTKSHIYIERFTNALV